MGGDESKGNECCESFNAVSFARKAEKSPESSSSRRVHARVAYSSKHNRVAAIDVASSSTLHAALTTNWYENTRTVLP